LDSRIIVVPVQTGARDFFHLQGAQTDSRYTHPRIQWEPVSMRSGKEADNPLERVCSQTQLCKIKMF